MKVPINAVACISLDAPTVAAHEVKRGGLTRWRFWCRHCGQWHYHGPAEGHREAHCTKPDSPYHQFWYNLALATAGQALKNGRLYMTTEAYQPVPVFAAERVATECDKYVCVIICYDRRHQKTHTTCFGKTPNDKVAGAALGKILSAAAGANVDRTSMGRHFEDVDKWEYALWVQYLQTAAAKALAQLTGVQAFPPGEVARDLHAALNVSSMSTRRH